jgi:hypothetical protein
MQIMKYSPGFLVFLSLTFATACQTPGPAGPELPQAAPQYTGEAVSLDDALSDIAAYYREHLPAHTRIALLSFETQARLLSDYIFEELWIRFEDSAAFTLVDRHNRELIEREISYQYSGMVSDESMLSIGKQFGPQTLLYGKLSPLGSAYRLVVYAVDVEQARTSIRSVELIPDRRFAALLETPSGAAAELDMANALYAGAGNPWRFTVQTDRIDGLYHDGEYMTLRIYSERDAYFKVTHIDVHGNAQVIYPVSPRDNPVIRAGETRQLPDNTRFRMTAPYGEEIILVGAYEKPFVIPGNVPEPLSNKALVRGLTVERADTQEDMRPLATAKFTYRIGP